MAPTRELAVQIEEEAVKFGRRWRDGEAVEVHGTGRFDP